MKDLIVWAIQTPAGTIGLVTATVAFSTQKGSVLHKKAGTCFVISMMIMLVSAFIAAYLKESTDDMFLSAVVIYTVFTAWLAVHHKKNQIGFLEYVALLWIVVIAVTAFFISAGWFEVEAPMAYLFVGSFAIVCAFGDIYNLCRPNQSGAQRVIRHVWRIGFSLLWAVLAVTDKVVKILGSNIKEMQQDQMLIIVAVPVILILITIFYWIANILFFSSKRFAGYGGSGS